MPDSNARTVRGLSIATIVISVLAILAVLVAIVFVAIVAGLVNDPAYVQQLMDETTRHGVYAGSLTSSEVAALVSFGVGTALIPLVWSVVCSTLALIAGILGLRNVSKPEKLGSAFVWSIVGAVAAFLTGRVITAVLLAISAVYLNKMRQAPAMPVGQPFAYGQPGAAGYGAGAYGQPTYGAYGQPQQPYGTAPYGQPTQPGAYGQPTASAPSGQPAGYGQPVPSGQPAGYEQPGNATPTDPQA